MTPADIERLLYELAVRRDGVAVAELRDWIAGAAVEVGASFEQCLQFVAAADRLGGSQRWQLFRTEYEMYQEEAARLGCTLEQLVKAYSRIGVDGSLGKAYFTPS